MSSIQEQIESLASDSKTYREITIKPQSEFTVCNLEKNVFVNILKSDVHLFPLLLSSQVPCRSVDEEKK